MTVKELKKCLKYFEDEDSVVIIMATNLHGLSKAKEYCYDGEYMICGDITEPFYSNENECMFIVEDDTYIMDKFEESVKQKEFIRGKRKNAAR